MKITFIGFGEAGSALVTGWGAARPGAISAYDIKLEDPATAGEIRARCAGLDVACVETLEEVLEGADMVFCTVTADQAVSAATAAAPLLGQGTTWLDLNSCAPSSKQVSAKRIEDAGGRYVDVAVMAPVHPKLNMVPLLISGPHAAEVAPVLEAMPLKLRVVEGEVGAASSIKMVRSIMVKGLEALTAECTLAAHAAGVAEEVFPSLRDGSPGIDLYQRAPYNFERSMVHGIRRSHEMEEVAKMLTDLGLPNGMAAATVDWQRRIAEAGAPVPEGGEDGDYRDFAEVLLPRIRKG